MTPQDPLLERARKRAKELRDFYGHLIIYLAVCTLLVVIDLLDDPSTYEEATEIVGLTWAYWPILGWGVFVVIHAAATFFGASRWEERKVQELYEQEKERDLTSH